MHWQFRISFGTVLVAGFAAYNEVVRIVIVSDPIQMIDLNRLPVDSCIAPVAIMLAGSILLICNPSMFI
ncbi:hypothetical protein AX777_05945 [Sphingobium yanoikuyae]|uniref:Uncharacterized protein n=1 Tax=Sphingobium yanoikuyae TaxID=13690 RepID=A0A177JN58_SPHYA|nr:hypothetical protein AX777_05945 [Sphingobium yanoikuyae]